MDKITWETIYRTQAPVLLGVCRRYISDPQTAEDIMHDAFLTAIHKQHTFTQKGPLIAWIRKITVNTALQHLRKEKRLFVTALEENTAEADEIETASEAFEDDPKSIILSADLREKDLLAALDELPEHHRVVFNLYVFESFSHKEIGELLQISVGTSKSHLARARKKLQSLLLNKAKAMKEKEKRAFGGIITSPEGKDAYIDRLYQNCLGDLSVPPAGNPDFLAQVIQKEAFQSAAGSTFPWHMTGVGIVSAGLVAALLFFKKPANEEANVETLQVTREVPVSPSVATSPEQHRSTAPRPQAQGQPVHSASAASVPAPVVINKQVVVKDTIFHIIK